MATGHPDGGGSLGPISLAPPGLACPPPPGTRSTNPAEGIGACPPGLWQPPGFGGITPSSLQSAEAPGLGISASFGAVGEGRGLELQKEISSTIKAQVLRLLEQVRHDTESKVKIELKHIRTAMMAMDARLDQLLSQLDCIEQPEPSEAPLDAKAIDQLLCKIEQQWGQEIRTLKQELHQTILAHNHNADLIKHHKDTIDSLRERCAKLAGNSVKTSEIQQQLQRLDTRLKQQHKQRKLEPLFERLFALEQRVAAAAQHSWRYPAMPPVAGVPPGMSGPPGIPPSMMPGMGTAATATAAMMAGKGTAGMKGGTADASAAAAAAAAAAAMNPAAAAATTAAGDGASERAAFNCPTDEEVQAVLSRLCVAPEALPSPAATDEVPEQGAPGLQFGSAAPAEPEEVSAPKELQEESVPEKTPVPALAEIEAVDETTEKSTLSEAA